MIGKIKNIFYLVLTMLFIFATASFYFSEKNKNLIIKSRIYYDDKINFDLQNLPFLESDTKDIIEYKNYIEEFKNKKKKRKFWELISNLNES